MFEKFEGYYQEIAKEMKALPWMQVIPHQGELQKVWNVDRWVAGSFSTYAVERMNGKTEAEAEAYTRKMNFRADFETLATPEAKFSFPDTPEAKDHFDKMVKGR